MYIVCSMTNTTDCNACGGLGALVGDDYTSRGEHCDDEAICDACDGTGEVASESEAA